jgi:hypothetical protein
MLDCANTCEATQNDSIKTFAAIRKILLTEFIALILSRRANTRTRGRPQGKRKDASIDCHEPVLRCTRNLAANGRFGSMSLKK